MTPEEMRAAAEGMLRVAESTDDPATRLAGASTVAICASLAELAERLDTLIELQSRFFAEYDPEDEQGG